MKYLFAVLLAFSFSFSASATDTKASGGKIFSKSKIVKVLAESGEVVEYSLSDALVFFDTNGDDSITLSNGAISRCPPYLGQLASEFAVVYTTQEGAYLEVRVNAPKEGETISVFGECNSDSKVLSELHINVKKGPKIEVVPFVPRTPILD